MKLILDNAQSEKTKINATEIIGYFESIRNNVSEHAHELVEYLEDGDWIEQEFHISKMYTKQYKKINSRYRAFCKVYLIIIFLELLDEYDAEIVLMMYGFIQGFESQKKGDEHVKYWEHAHTYIKRLDKVGESKPHILRKEEKEIIQKLAETLEKIVSNSNGKLNFAEDVLEAFSNNAIPEKLSLPITEYFTHSYTYKGEPKKDSDNQIIGINNPETTTTLPTGDPNKKSKNKFRAILSKYLPRIKNIFEHRKNTNNDNRAHRFHAIFIFFVNINTGSKAELAKVTKAIYTLTGVLMASAVIWGVIKPSIEKEDIIRAAMDIVAPAIDNIPPSAAEAYIDSSLLVEMETFSIDKGDKDIPLAPGYSKVLPIKNPEPSNADISTLKVESLNESIVWEKNGYLTASDNIPEGETYKVFIKITAKKHIEFICITVESPAISDDAEGMVGSGTQPDY